MKVNGSFNRRRSRPIYVLTPFKWQVVDSFSATPYVILLKAVNKEKI